MPSYYNDDGCGFTAYDGSATGTPLYPADFMGATTTTPANSVLHNAKAVQLLGIRITTSTGLSTMSYVNAAGTPVNVTGATTIATTSTGRIYHGNREDGVKFTNGTNANIGFTCTNAAVRFTMYWRKLA